MTQCMLRSTCPAVVRLWISQMYRRSRRLLCRLGGRTAKRFDPTVALRTGAFIHAHSFKNHYAVAMTKDKKRAKWLLRHSAVFD